MVDVDNDGDDDDDDDDVVDDDDDDDSNDETAGCGGRGRTHCQPSNVTRLQNRRAKWKRVKAGVAPGGRFSDFGFLECSSKNLSYRDIS